LILLKPVVGIVGVGVLVFAFALLPAAILPYLIGLTVCGSVRLSPGG
jgi:hypothetical protein